MAKVNITKPTGTVENLGLVSAFKADGNTYAIFDSEKTGSMGLPIIYVSKFNEGKLEKINDTNEWQNAKNYLKGIISGTNFEYIKLGDALNADEVYYMPLTLPQASFDLIKSRYVVNESVSSASSEAPVMETLGDTLMPSEQVEVSSALQSVATPATNNETMAPAINIEPAVVQPVSEPQVSPALSVSTPLDVNMNASQSPQAVETSAPSVATVTPVMPSNQPVSNEVVSTTPVQAPQVVENKPAEVSFSPSAGVSNSSAVNTINNFEADKETFLKACENMFEALISKYQKQLADLASREEALIKKEAELAAKSNGGGAAPSVSAPMPNNQNAVPGAMDLNNLMPSNPNINQTGVI